MWSGADRNAAIETGHRLYERYVNVDVRFRTVIFARGQSQEFREFEIECVRV